MLNQQLEQIVTEYAIKNLFSGVVRIKKDNITLYEGAFGYASKAFRTPNRMDFKFATASVTKMFTALAILQLVEQGKLQLSDAITDYIDFNESTLHASITLEHLLSHTSGVAEYFDKSDPDGFIKLWQNVPGQYIDSVHKMLPLFIDEPLEFTAGERFSYSGSGYVLLGMVIEQLTGMDYYSYMREHIFKANYLYETDFIPIDRVEDNVANGYIAIKDARNQILGWQKNIYAVPAYGLPDGGVYTTAKDMIKFLRMLRQNELLSEKMTSEWLKPRVKVDEGLYYGLGMWLTYDDDEKLRRYGHTGEDPGVSARVYHYPQHNIDLVLFSNHDFSTSALLSALQEVFL